MGSFAADVRDRRNGAGSQFTLDAEAPLLYVRPYGLSRDCRHIQRISASATAPNADSADALPSEGLVLGHIQNLGRTAFQRSGVRFIAGSMMEKHTVAAANRGLAVALRIPGKTQTGRGVKQVTLHATSGDTGHTAL